MIDRLLPSGLLTRAVVRVLPLTILVMLAIGMATSRIVETTITRQTHTNMMKDARFGAQAVAASLTAILRSVRSIASNELVINALVDVEARQAYLPLFFNQMQVAGLGPGGRIAFTDYKGRVVASNWNAPNQTNAIWLSRVIESDKEYLEFDAEGALFVVPVAYHGKPEGAIVVSFPKSMMADVFGLSVGAKAAHVSTPQSDIFTSDPAFAKAYRAGIAEREGWIQAHASVPGYPGIQVTVAERSHVAFAVMNSLKTALTIAIVLAILALTSGTIATAYFTTNPIRRFADELEKFGAAEDIGRRISAKGSAEFNDLVAAFNAVFDRLQAMVESHADLADQYKTHQQMEKRLQLENAHFATALENMAQGLCVFDKDQRVVVSNERYASIYGLTSDQVKPGTSLEEILHARVEADAFVGENPDAYLKERLSWGGNREHEGACYHTLRDGRIIRIARVPLVDGSWVATHEEVNASETPERSSDDVLSFISDEIHGPLEALVEALRLAGMEGHYPSTEMTGPLLQVAYRDADTTKSLIADILEMEAIRSGQLVLSKTETDIVDLADHAIEHVLSFEDASEVNLRLEESVENAKVEVDEDRMQRVISRLLSSAVRSSAPNTEIILRLSRDSGKIRIAVAVEGAAAPDELQLLISDDSKTPDEPASMARGNELAFGVAKSMIEHHESVFRIEAAGDLGWTCYFDLDECDPPARSVLDEITAELAVDDVEYDSDAEVAYI